MQTPALLVEREGPIVILTLNRPDRRNALSAELRSMLGRAIRDADADPDVRALILTGSGDRAFSAGLDLKELGNQSDHIFASGGFGRDLDPIVAMASCAKPIVGAVNGAAITGGFEIALACDILIGSENARFVDTHLNVEVLPGWGLSQRLARIVGPSRAKEISFTGYVVDARTAQAWGLINRIVPAVELLQEAKRIAHAVSVSEPVMVARYKALIDTGLEKAFGDALAYEREQASRFNAAISGEAIGTRFARATTPFQDKI